MQEQDRETQVLIVGAGPTGLSLACQLARYGVDFLLVEKREALTTHSKAIAVHARTLEIYEQLGLAQKAISQGTLARTMQMWADGEPRATIDFSNIGAGLSEYPFVLLLEQDRNERLLYDQLSGDQDRVLWSHELVAVLEDEEQVTARIKGPDDARFEIRARYIVGCDGPRSMVRHKMGTDFVGSTLERIFYVADANVQWAHGHESLHVCLSRDAFLLVFPLSGEGRQRIAGVLSAEAQERELDVEALEELAQRASGMAMTITELEWSSTYKVHSRHAEHFWKGRIFLAGDAAHVHTPAGGQGMNTGIQDAYNLAWKLAMRLDGRGDDTLFASYDEERVSNARVLLRTTDQAFDVAAGTNRVLEFLRTNVMPFVMSHALEIERVKKIVFPRLSQIGIHYRQSALSAHEGERHFAVEAGDRMPYVELEGESVYAWLTAPKLHWVVCGQQDVTTREAVPRRDQGWVERVDLPLSAPLEAAFGVKGPFAVLLRPDNHIALLSQECSYEVVKRYMQQHFWRKGSA